MPWAPARFKDQDVWAEVDDGGALRAKAGRVAIRWSDRPGAKRYEAGATRVQLTGGPPIAIDDDGASRNAVPGAAKVAAEPKPGDGVGYTDGACTGNPGPAGSGVLLMLPDGRVAEATRSLGHATNNIAEITALIVALELLDEAALPPDAPVVLFTDSEYAIGVLTRGWKAKKNQELIADTRARLARRPGVRLGWVRGHQGNAGNERADGLAREAARGATWVRWQG